MNIKLIEPYGYCFGVRNALKLVLDLRKRNPSSVILLSRPLIHNEYTNNKLVNEYNICLLKNNQSYLKNSYIVFSAHGFTSKDLKFANENYAFPIDTTCPFLKRAKINILNDMQENKNIIFIGKKGHPETDYILDIDSKINFISVEDLRQNKLNTIKNIKNTVIYPQSTISLDDYNLIKDILKNETFKDIKLHSICFECLKRWKTSLMIKTANNDAFVVVGSKTSSNSVEFYNLLKKHYALDVYLLSSTEEALNITEKIKSKNTIYLVSGTSAPKELILKIKEALDN